MSAQAGPSATPGTFPTSDSMSTKPLASSTRNPWASTYTARPSVKLDNIDVLEGHANYDDWVDQMTIVFTAMGCEELVVEGSTPDVRANQDEINDYKALRSQALLVLIQSISKPILRVVAKKKDPHAIWKHLKETYHRDTAFSFVYQITNFSVLSTSYDPSKPIKDFIDKFESEWEKLSTLANSPSTSSLPHHLPRLPP